ncbi:hypothetical protein CtesDRAFT_PD3377 [Comamonas testosteroni KF-1]|uniref:Uncharacterized protein n=1 Tax=Comamonas testosteroni (strain DSM 14576 / KF-1) TaxID=399795 RepID=B7X1S4_COMTK|nr:hypothetical protein CtesDRAFT_PD3314 [Comamonas testosteroni KF-1]EED68430.1 hypothetical protein CtesDRAFT_PD3377 [Comamonas testosteroni KF-1]
MSLHRPNSHRCRRTLKNVEQLIDKSSRAAKSCSIGAKVEVWTSKNACNDCSKKGERQNQSHAMNELLDSHRFVSFPKVELVLGNAFVTQVRVELYRQVPVDSVDNFFKNEKLQLSSCLFIQFLSGISAAEMLSLRSLKSHRIKNPRISRMLRTTQTHVNEFCVFCISARSVSSWIARVLSLVALVRASNSST